MKSKIIYLLTLLTLVTACNKEEIELKEEEAVSAKAINSSSNTEVDYIVKNTSNLIGEAEKEEVDWKFQYVDTFDKANNGSDYGLNSNLGERQLYGEWKGSTWERRSGFWSAGGPIVSTASQVNHPSYTNGNTLTFHQKMASVMLYKRIWPGNSYRYRVQFDTDPALSNTTSSDWTSFMLDNSQYKNGFVSKTDFGFLISSHGGVQVFKQGKSQGYTSKVGNLTQKGEYRVVLDISPERVIIDINNGEVTYTYPGVKIESAHPYLGAYFNPASTNTKVSSFDNLVINTPNDLNEQHINYYGYYWTIYKETEALSSNFEVTDVTNHSNVINDYTNFNFVSNVRLLDGLPDNGRKYSVQVYWDFWNVFDESKCRRVIDESNGVTYWERWRRTLDKIIEHKNKISAIYMVDEPFVLTYDEDGYCIGKNIPLYDYQNIVAVVKKDLRANGINLPVCTMLSFDTLDDGDNWEDLVKPVLNDYVDDQGEIHDANIDVIGMNRYHRGDFKTHMINPYLHNLLARVNWYNRKMILAPEASTNCNDKVSTDILSTDAEVAINNWENYEYALENANVIGLKNFGLWSHGKPEDIPITMEVQKLLGNAIINY